MVNYSCLFLILYFCALVIFLKKKQVRSWFMYFTMFFTHQNLDLFVMSNLFFHSFYFNFLFIISLLVTSLGLLYSSFSRFLSYDLNSLIGIL